MPSRSRQPQVLRASAEHAVGVGLHLRRDLGGVRLRCDLPPEGSLILM